YWNAPAWRQERHAHCRDGLLARRCRGLTVTSHGPVGRLFHTALVFEAVEMIDGSQEEGAVRDGDRGPAHLVEPILAEELEIRPRLDNVSAARIVQTEDLAIVGPGRRGEAARPRQPPLVQLFARLGFIAAHQAITLIQDVKATLIEQWRGR